jgi:hypothetical protein
VEHAERRIRAIRRRGRARVAGRQQRAARAAGPLAAGMLGATLVAACASGSSGLSGTTPSDTQTQSRYEQAIAYAQCIRTHGVSNFPDPNSQGELTPDGINPSSPQFQSAQKACQSLDKDAHIMSPQKQATLVQQAVKYANCMRSHGILNFPEPPAPGSGPTMVNPNSVNTASPQFAAAQQACRKYLPTSAAP